MTDYTKKELFEIVSEAVKGKGELEFSKSLPFKLKIYDSSYKYDIYIWNLHDPGQTCSKHPDTKYKMSLKLRNIDFSTDYFPIILAYSPDYEVFLMWDANRYRPTTSRDVQVKEDSIVEASIKGTSYQYMMTQYGIQKVLLGTKSHFLGMLSERRSLYYQDLINRPMIKIKALPRHGSFSLIYAHCLTHPDYTSFELARDLNLPMKSVIILLDALHVNNDVPRTHLCKEEIDLIVDKINKIIDDEPHCTNRYIELKLALPKNFIEKYENYINRKRR